MLIKRDSLDLQISLGYCWAICAWKNLKLAEKRLLASLAVSLVNTLIPQFLGTWGVSQQQSVTSRLRHLLGV